VCLLALEGMSTLATFIQTPAAQLKIYFTQSWNSDLIASLTVAMIAIPQSMAYASIAGVNPIYGLYTAIIPAIVASFFGSSNHVVTGPTNTIALATSSVLIALIGQADYHEYVFAVAILTGVFMLLLGVFRLGALIRYVSNAVLTGFLAGASILIILNQLVNIMGIPSSESHKAIDILVHIFSNMNQSNPLVIFIGMITVIFLLVSKKLWPKLPAALVAMLLISVSVQFFGWYDYGVRVISDIGDVSQAGLAFHIPVISLKDGNAQTLLSGAGAIALLSLLEALTIAKAIGLQTGQRINPSREFIGQGLASIAGGFFRSIPTSGSLSRSAVNFEEGAITRVSSGLSGVIVLVALILFKKWIGLIPLVSLSGVVIVSSLHLIDIEHIKLTWRGRAISRVVLSITFISVLLLPLQISIYLGVLLSILFYLFESSHLKLTNMVLNGNGKFSELELDDILQKDPDVVIVNVEGDLYFAAVDDLEAHINKIIDSSTKVIILRIRRMRLIASTGVTALEGLLMQAECKGTTILLSGVSEETLGILRNCGISERIGEYNIFPATEIPYASTRRALECEKQI